MTTDEKWIDADRRIRVRLKSDARGELVDDAFETVVARAMGRWLKEGQVEPEVYAQRCLGSWRIEQRERRERGTLHVAVDADQLPDAGGDPLEWLEAKEREEELVRPFANLEDAKKPTLRVCNRAFLELVGKRWGELPAWVVRRLKEGHKEHAETERLARDALAKVRDAIKAVRVVAKRGEQAGGVRASAVRRLADTMRGWDDLLEPDDPNLDVTPASLTNHRQWVAYYWPQIRELLFGGRAVDLPALEELFRSDRLLVQDMPVPEVRTYELAIVSILAGDWPEGMRVGTEGVKPDDIIKTVERGFGATAGAKPKAGRVATAGVRAFGEKKK